MEAVIVKSPMETTAKNLSSLAEKIREAIIERDDEYIRKLHADGEYLETTIRKFEEIGKNWVALFSSWCRFPFYETDFGWGKPIWLATAMRSKKLAIFLDTSDGKGIEVWLTLTEEEMAKLEQDPAILNYATFRPSL